MAPKTPIVLRLSGSDTLSGFVDAITLPDGTVWSHAAVLGTYEHPQGQFTIDEKKLRSFVANFETGYPSKVPVDYDHGTTSGIADGSQIVRKAGDIVEMRAVLEAKDMTPEIKAVVEKYRARRAELKIKSREPNEFGLWVRWLPTTRGLDTVKSREYTEMSISFVDALQDNKGEVQGPTILAVALTNVPFLDEMIPIAASRAAAGGSAADSAQRTTDVPTNRLLMALSALLGKPVETDDDAVTELATLRTKTTELTALSNFRTAIATEFAGETSADKIVAQVKELRAKVTTAETQAKDARKKSASDRAEAIVKGHESKLLAPERAYFVKQLAAELEVEPDEKKSEIVKLLEAKTGLKILANSRESAVDTGHGIDEDTAIAAKAEELYNGDAAIKALAATDPNAARLKALTQAGSIVRAGKTRAA
jgi:hypothetical protein